MKIYLDKYQEALLLNHWNLKICLGLMQLHFYWSKTIKNKSYDYYEKEISPEDICKRHKIKIFPNDVKVFK